MARGHVHRAGNSVQFQDCGIIVIKATLAQSSHTSQASTVSPTIKDRK